ncbi:mCG112958, isoform CRA_b, partial [Mus musculus]
KVLFESSGKVHRDSSLQSDLSGKLTVCPSYTEISSEMAVQALNKELCFQWYIPPLDKPLKDSEPMNMILECCSEIEALFSNNKDKDNEPPPPMTKATTLLLNN